MCYMEDRENTCTDTSPEHLEKILELIRENQLVFEELSCSNLPIAKDAERALALLDSSGEDS